MKIDEVWMAVKEDPRGPLGYSVIYAFGHTPKDLWETIEDGELMGTGVTRKELQAQGYRATLVQIHLP